MAGSHHNVKHLVEENAEETKNFEAELLDETENVVAEESVENTQNLQAGVVDKAKNIAAENVTEVDKQAKNFMTESMENTKNVLDAGDVEDEANSLKVKVSFVEAEPIHVGFFGRLACGMFHVIWHVLESLQGSWIHPLRSISLKLGALKSNLLNGPPRQEEEYLRILKLGRKIIVQCCCRPRRMPLLRVLVTRVVR